MLTLWLVLGILVAVFPKYLVVWLIFGLFILMLLQLEAVAVLRLRKTKILRFVPSLLKKGETQLVTLLITNPGPRSATIEVTDDAPDDIQVTGLPQRIKIPAYNKPATAEYQIKPLHSGRRTFKFSTCIVHSPLKLWRYKIQAPNTNTISVYSKPINQSLEKNRKRKLPPLGLETPSFNKETREITGQWPLTEQYSADNMITGRHVLVLIDGVLELIPETNRASYINEIEVAISNLTHLVLLQRDRIGLYANHKGAKLLPPTANEQTLKSMSNTLDEFKHSTTYEPLSNALTQASQQIHNRVFLVIITASAVHQNHTLLTVLKRIKNQHAVLLINVHDESLSQLRNHKPQNYKETIELLAIEELFYQLSNYFKTLQSVNINTLLTTPGQITQSLATAYNKVRGQL